MKTYRRAADTHTDPPGPNTFLGLGQHHYAQRISLLGRSGPTLITVRPRQELV
jgi:hypothetical protein